MKSPASYKYILFLFLGVALGIFGYQEVLYRSDHFVTKVEHYERFEQVFAVLEDMYYDQEKINVSKMLEEAVKAYVDALDDPYTSYLDAKTNSGFMQDLKGETDFQGIGAIISKKDYYILVEEIVKDSPAFKSGLWPLDRIVMINSGETKDMTIDDAVSLIRGPKGTSVSLMIERVSKDQKKVLFEKVIQRDNVLYPSVQTTLLTGSSLIGVLEISVIGEETENLLKKELLELKEKKIQGLIIDLRGNGGGFLPIAVDIASHFIPKNKLVVSSRYKQLGTEDYYSKGYKSMKIPLVVLIDGLTASAGEIIALALQEQLGATLIGTTTFGKGSIQTLYDFDDGASLKYTIGKRYSPSGKNIDGVGIEPDILVEFDGENYLDTTIDNQLEKAKETLLQMM